MSDDLVMLRESEIDVLIRDAVDEALEVAAVEIENTPERRPVEWHNGMDAAAAVVRSHKRRASHE